MRNVTDTAVQNPLLPMLDQWKHQESTGIGLLLAAILIAGFGMGLAAQAYLRSQNLRFSWRSVGIGVSRTLWLLPIVAVLALFGLYFARQAHSVSYQRRHLSGFSFTEWPSTSVRRAGAKISKALAMRDRSSKGRSSKYVELGTAGSAAPISQQVATQQVPDQKKSTTEPSAVPTSGESSTSADGNSQKDPQLPDWIGKTNVVEQPGDRHLVILSSELEGSREEAEADVLHAAAVLVGSNLASANSMVGDWQPTADSVRREAVRLMHVAAIHRKTVSSGMPFDVYRAYCQVELSPIVRAHLMEQWKDEVVNQRISALAGLAGLLTLTFGTIAAYFRLDSRTSGKYRRRLKLAAVSVVTAGGIAAAALI